MPIQPQILDPQTVRRVDALLADGKSWRAIAEILGVPRSTLQLRYEKTKVTAGEPVSPGTPDRIERENRDTGEKSVEVKTHCPVKTLEDAIRVAEVDESIWYVHSWECRAWTTPLNIKRGQKKTTVKKPRYNASTKSIEDHEEEELRWRSSKATQQQQFLVALKLRRKSPEVLSVESLLGDMGRQKIKLPVYKLPARTRTPRALEISIMDPHLGLRCYRPQADTSWSLDEAEEMFMATVERLLEQAEIYGPFAEIITAIGNDYFHADNVFHTTTAGTAQPEMESLHEVLLRGEKLMLWKTERLRKISRKLTIKSIPGNHDRVTSFSMARLVHAFYQGAKIGSVEVDASPSPYKFWHYGPTLIGFDHGHSINPLRLAALMANETRTNGWQQARYCEWHLADQHRKGGSRPYLMEEQGVSFEYLPSLTPANEWHRLKGLNWQKRGAMAFVYDQTAGPLARLQINVDSYTGRHMGQ